MTATASCTRCGTSLPVTLKFCDVCGEELTRPAPYVSRPSPREEKLRRTCGFWIELFRSLPQFKGSSLIPPALRVLKKTTQLDGPMQDKVLSWLQEAVEHPVALQRAAEAVSSTLGAEERMEFHRHLCEVCWADDARLSQAEMATLKTVSLAFGLSQAVQRSAFFHRFGPVTVCEYILGVSRDAPAAAIEAAYESARSGLTACEHESGSMRHRTPERLQQLSVAYRELMKAKRR